MSTMLATLRLDLDGYQVIFNFTELNKTGTILEGFVELVPKPGMEGPGVTSIEAGTTLKDIRRLRKYFEEHLLQKAAQDS